MNTIFFLKIEHKIFVHIYFLSFKVSQIHLLKQMYSLVQVLIYFILCFVREFTQFVYLRSILCLTFGQISTSIYMKKQINFMISWDTYLWINWNSKATSETVWFHYEIIARADFWLFNDSIVFDTAILSCDLRTA